MSTIKAEVVSINDIRPHSNADWLELATVNGWQMVVRKGQHHEGQRVVYFEQGTVMPRDVADRFGVTGYLSEKSDIDGNRVLVVHRVKLRGEPSFGLAVLPDDLTWQIGTDVSGHYGVTKFNPPVKATAGDAEVDHPLFPTYTDIENMRSYPNVFKDGEPVEATEKIHGTNVRVGFIREGDSLIPLAGSRTLRRKMPEADRWQSNTYWFPMTVAGVRDVLTSLLTEHNQVVLFGEVHGKGVQSYDYGQRGLAFRAFDLMIDGKYVDREMFYRVCEQFDIPTVPVVYHGPFDMNAIKAVSDGPSEVGGSHGREGVVVRPLTERQDVTIGRVILKYIGDEYLFSKAAKDDTTDQ